MSDDKREDSWQHTVLLGLGALAVAALLIGLSVGAVAALAARATGVGETSAAPEAAASLYMPTYTETPEEDERTVIEGGGAPVETQVTAIPLDPTDTPTSAVGEITLFANPTAVVSGEKINLSGVYLDGEGVALQVQRQEGDAWVDFPTEAAVRSGGFNTFVYTGRTGDNVFRVFDPTTGRSSNPITVVVS